MWTLRPGLLASNSGLYTTNVPFYPIAERQKTQRVNPTRPPNQFNRAISDNIKWKKCFVEINGGRYPKDPVEANHTENKFIDQYRCLTSIYMQYKGESLINLLISYLDMKIFHPIQVFNRTLQIDYVTPKKI